MELIATILFALAVIQIPCALGYRNGVRRDEKENVVQSYERYEKENLVHNDNKDKLSYFHPEVSDEKELLVSSDKKENLGIRDEKENLARRDEKENPQSNDELMVAYDEAEDALIETKLTQEHDQMESAFDAVVSRVVANVSSGGQKPKVKCRTNYRLCKDLATETAEMQTKQKLVTKIKLKAKCFVRFGLCAAKRLFRLLGRIHGCIAPLLTCKNEANGDFKAYYTCATGFIGCLKTGPQS